jgi:uncharacterized protein (DUF169 family)
MDYAAAHQVVVNTLRTVSEPLGLALIRSGEGWPERVLRPVDQGLRVSMCQWTNLARRRGVVVGLRAEDIACAPCQVALGLKLLPEPSSFVEFIRGMGYMSDGAMARSVLSEQPPLAPGAFQGLIAFPLREAPRDPDVVWIYGNPAQMNHLVIALMHERGRPVPSTAGLGLTCRAGIVDEPRILFPGRGERVMACTGEDELFMALPASALPDLVRGLDATSAKGIRAPIMGPAPHAMPDLPPLRRMAAALVDP